MADWVAALAPLEYMILPGAAAGCFLFAYRLLAKAVRHKGVDAAVTPAAPWKIRKGECQGGGEYDAWRTRERTNQGSGGDSRHRGLVSTAAVATVHAAKAQMMTDTTAQRTTWQRSARPADEAEDRKGRRLFPPGDRTVTAPRPPGSPRPGDRWYTVPAGSPLSGALAALLALSSVVLVTLALSGMQPYLRGLAPGAPYVRPYGIAFVAPIALATALAGWRLGLFTLAASALSFAFFLTDPHLYLLVARPRDRVELGLLVLIGGLVLVTTDAQRRSATLVKQARLAVLRQRDFLRDVLHVVSEEKLRLCDRETDLPLPLPEPLGGPISITSSAPISLRELRRLARQAASELALAPERAYDLETATGEAAMNALMHGGGGGAGRVYLDRDRGVIQVWVRDAGSGIREEHLHRATLEKGFSSIGTLGHGFPLMIRCADRIYLLTGAGGTTVVIEQDATTA